MKKLNLVLLLLFAGFLPLSYAVEVEKSGVLIADGSYEIRWDRGDEGTIDLAGNFGSGTVTLFLHVDDPGNASDPTEGAWIQFDLNNDLIINTGDGITTASGYIFTTGALWIRITLAGSTGAEIFYRVKETNK